MVIPSFALAFLMQTGPTPLDPLPPERRLIPVAATSVRLRDDAFFAPWFRRNLEVTLRYGHEQLEKHGQFRNFRLAAGQETGDYSGVHFYDSDAYKWLEAASLALAFGADPELAALIDRFIAEIAAAQEADGYVQTQYTSKRQERWSRLPDDHELYCAGHLIQAAIAHHAVTGKRTLYDVALRFADCIDRTFGPGKRPGCCGHPEIETALVELHRHSGEKRWLDLAAFFLEERGQKPPRAGGDFYRQDDKPIREQKAAAGHAVRQLYLCSGMTGVAAETGDRGLFDAALAISRDIDRSKLYVTGGVGARHDGEAFGQPFELPNLSAYAETCASIALMRFSHELLALTGQASFADRLENTLYNAFLAATGADGRSFFYVNPLESTGGKQRQPWFWCACCPPNIMRTFAGLPGWFASTAGDALYLHLYDNVDVAAQVGAAEPLELRVKTGYPWDGRVVVNVVRAPAAPVTLALRIPAWAGGEHDVFLDEGEATQPGTSSGGCDFDVRKGADGYLRARGRFRAGHRLVLTLTPVIETMTADPRVTDNVGKVALRHGPVHFAFESPDQPDVDLFRTSLDLAGGFELSFVYSPGRTWTNVTLAARGQEFDAVARTGLYGAQPPSTFRARAVALTAIPYYAWANRGDSKMRLWMPVASSLLGAAAAGGAPAQVPAAPLSRPEATFGSDVKFLEENADVLVLRADGCGPVAVSPKLTGRVMTSAFSEQEGGFGLVNREAIAQPPVARGFSNYGGEDRLWFAPEGGPCGLFFDPGAKQELANWYVPPAMDGGPRTVKTKNATSVFFADLVTVGNVRGVKFRLTVGRSIKALSRGDIEQLVGAKLPDTVRAVAFRSENALAQAGEGTLPEDALLAPWILGQFKPSPATDVLVPFRGGVDVVKNDYFGVVPKDRLQVALVPGTDGGTARFKGDSMLRSKIGVGQAAATGWVGAFDRRRGVLTLVNHTVPPSGAIVPDCDWADPNPRAKSGDVATSYNHGQEPRFFELESIGSALPARAGSTVTHVHTTIHLAGDAATLAHLAKTLLRADL